MTVAKLHSLREQRGFGVRELARRAGVSAGYLTRIEGGRAVPTAETLSKLAVALDVPPSELIADNTVAVDHSPEATIGRDLDRLIWFYRTMGPRQRRLVLGIAEELARQDPEHAPLAPSAERPAQPLVYKSGSTHYMQGWLRSTVLADREAGQPLIHAGGEQFSRRANPILPGDVIWIVSVYRGSVLLHAPMVVASRAQHLRDAGRPDDVIFSQREAERVVGMELWNATEHLLATHLDNGELLEDFVLSRDAISRLRFRQGTGRVTTVGLDRRTGRVSGQAFRALRELTPDAATEIETVWKGHHA